MNDTIKGSNNMQADLIQFARRLLEEQGQEVSGQSDKQIKSMLDQIPRNDQIKLLAMRSAYRLAGGTIEGTQTLAQQQAGVGVVTADPAAMARTIRMIVKNFDHSTPDDGSVFWTGVDRNKLRYLISTWNKQHPTKMFGQLEATTDTRFMDGVLGGDWNTGGGKTYFDAASAALGRGATGHVTSVQMYGLQSSPDKIFTNVELPALLKSMDDDLANNKQPKITNLSIIVINPIGYPETCRTFTNLQICSINLIKNIGGKAQIYNASQGAAAGKVGLHGPTRIPDRVRHYWLQKYPVPVSATAQTIAQNIASILYGPDRFDFNKQL
ncbi:hypothetical protein K3729_10560 [Rhodobacteraceae bacterium S2214]|nr:hypothetical protein K3729_10560 [Rhodobacteraceae bacterium S2214]